MNKSIITDFRKLIDVNTPIIYINDYDYARIDTLILEVAGTNVWEWNPATGGKKFNINGLNGDETSLEQFLKDKYSIDVQTKERFLLLRDIQDLIEETAVKTLLQLIAQRKLYDREYNTTIIIVSPVLKVPDELEKYVSFLDIPFPDDAEINELIDEHIE